MKLIVFSGFLGSGKTMAILSLAASLMDGAGSDRTRLVIIENEVGTTGIDDTILENAGLEFRSLLSGCICCTMAVDLIKTITDIAEHYNPEYVIFEPSGVAYPERITDSLQKYVPDLEWVCQITIVDTRRWDALHTVTPALMDSQVETADFILMNKCDLVSMAELEATEKQIHKLNPVAKCYRTVATQGLPEELLRKVIDSE